MAGKGNAMQKTKNHTTQQVENQVLVIDRIFDAPRPLVFKSWTEPERMMQWWGPKGFTCPVCKIDLRPGGEYLSCMRSPEGRDYWSKGVYREIVGPERIICTDAFADEHGNTVSPQQYGMSADWPQEATLMVLLTEDAGKTKVMLRHWPIKPGPECEMCRQGWNESLDKLADYLAKAILEE
jgi:uncharacterized protein YndB with AHSA1/START domain